MVQGLLALSNAVTWKIENVSNELDLSKEIPRQNVGKCYLAVSNCLYRGE